MNLESGVMQIHIEDIIPNRFQPRLSFDDEGLKELADSIKEHGIIQPLVLRKLGNKYEIIAGERRYKAATIAGLTTVPAVIANVDDNKAAEVAIVENVQRKDLTAIEEARSYKNLLDKGYLTQEQLAKRMGLSQPAIANKLRLLNLDEEVQQALLEEKISERHARTLLSLPDKEMQREWLHKIINERLTVRQLDLELKKLKDQQANTDEEDDESDEVPLVESPRNIDDIKAQATDLKDLNKKMSSEEIMQPMNIINKEIETLEPTESEETNPIDSIEEPINSEEPTAESIDNIENKVDQQNENPFTVATTVPETNIVTPESTSSYIEPDQTITSKSEGKFFNADELINSPISPIENIEQNSDSTNNQMEIFDKNIPTNTFTDEISDIPFTPPKQPTPSNDSINSNNKFIQSTPLNTDFELNPNNRFFTPVLEPKEENNFNQEENKIVNPMDSIDKINGTYEQKEQIESEKGLKNAITTIRNCIEGLGDKGYSINVEEIDFDDNYQINIQIKKDN